MAKNEKTVASCPLAPQKNMETKNATIRIPHDVLAWIEAGRKSKNETIVDALRVLRKMRQVSVNELRGIFTPKECSFFADSLNRLEITDAFRCSTSALIAHVKDAADPDCLDAK